MRVKIMRVGRKDAKIKIKNEKLRNPPLADDYLEICELFSVRLDNYYGS